MFGKLLNWFLPFFPLLSRLLSVRFLKNRKVMKPNILRLVSATVDRVAISFEVVTAPERRTSYGEFRFDRNTADLSMLWTVDGRQALSFSDRLSLLFWCLRTTKSIVK